MLAIGVRSAAHPGHWTVLVHAHPSTVGTLGTVPPAWSADTVLAGSFSHPEEGNYDGKYLLDGGRLYLLYVKNFVPEPALRNGIVIQPMLSPRKRRPKTRLPCSCLASAMAPSIPNGMVTPKRSSSRHPTS